MNEGVANAAKWTFAEPSTNECGDEPLVSLAEGVKWRYFKELGIICCWNRCHSKCKLGGLAFHTMQKNHIEKKIRYVTTRTLKHIDFSGHQPCINFSFTHFLSFTGDPKLSNVSLMTKAGGRERRT